MGCNFTTNFTFGNWVSACQTWPKVFQGAGIGGLEKGAVCNLQVQRVPNAIWKCKEYPLCILQPPQYYNTSPFQSFQDYSFFLGLCQKLLSYWFINPNTGMNMNMINWACHNINVLDGHARKRQKKSPFNEGAYSCTYVPNLSCSYSSLCVNMLGRASNKN